MTFLQQRTLTTPQRSRLYQTIKKTFFSSQGFSLFLTLTILGIMFVLFRMKNLELDYNMSSIKKSIDKVTLENKELRAVRASLLSTDRLRKMAKKHSFQQPKQEQIIIIP